MAFSPANLSGGCTIVREMYVVNAAGRRLRDITNRMLSCSIRWDQSMSGGSHMTIEFSIFEDPDEPLYAARDIVAPFITYRWGDGTVRATPWGMFQLSLPRRKITGGGTISTYRGRDMTWRLYNERLTRNENTPAGASYQTEFARILGLGGIEKYRVRATGRTVGTAKTARRGMHRREQFNNLSKSISWYNIHAALDGALETLPYRDWLKTDPVGVITKRLVSGDIGENPEIEEVPNVVMVEVQPSEGEPYVRFARNNNPDSASSIINVGREITTEPFRESDIETTTDAEKFAENKLRELSSYEQILTVNVKPDPLWLGIHRTVDISDEFDRSGHRIAGRYHIKGFKVGAEPDTALVELTLGKSIRMVETS
jgi:hypothetical protein